MTTRVWGALVGSLACAYVAAFVCAELLYGQFEGEALRTASGAAQLLAFGFVSAAVAVAVRIGRPFAAPGRRLAVGVAAGAAAVAASPFVGLLVPVQAEQPLAAAVLGVGMATVAVATVRLRSSAALVASEVGLWVVFGALVAGAGLDSLLRPAHTLHGSSDRIFGNDAGVELALALFLATLAGLAVVQLLALLAARRLATRTQRRAGSQAML